MRDVRQRRNSRGVSISDALLMGIFILAGTHFMTAPVSPPNPKIEAIYQLFAKITEYALVGVGLLSSVLLLVIIKIFANHMIWYARKAVPSIGLSKRAPGASLLTASRLLFSPKTFQRIIEPTILDMRSEVFDALLQNRLWEARIARVRGYYGYFNAVWVHGVASLVKTAVRVWSVIG